MTSVIFQPYQGTKDPTDSKYDADINDFWRDIGVITTKTVTDTATNSTTEVTVNYAPIDSNGVMYTMLDNDNNTCKTFFRFNNKWYRQVDITDSSEYTNFTNIVSEIKKPAAPIINGSIWENLADIIDLVNDLARQAGMEDRSITAINSTTATTP